MNALTHRRFKRLLLWTTVLLSFSFLVAIGWWRQFTTETQPPSNPAKNAPTVAKNEVPTDNKSKSPVAGKIRSAMGLKAGELMPPKPGSPDYRYQKTAIEVFGEKQGEPVNSGFVFKDGAYIDTPYTLSRKGGDVFINNKVKVGSIGNWPPQDWEDSIPDDVLKGLTRQSTFKDLKTPGRSEWEGKMLRCVKRHYGKDEALKVMAENYRRLPFVKDVKIGDEELFITTWSGDKKHVDFMFGFDPHPYKAPTPEECRKMLDGICLHWEERLKAGDCYFLSNGAGELSFGKMKVKDDLAAIVHVLCSDDPKKIKIENLQKLGLGFYDLKSFDLMFGKFSPSPQLEERIKRLQSPKDNAPKHNPTPGGKKIDELEMKRILKEYSKDYRPQTKTFPPKGVLNQLEMEILGRLG